MIDETQKTLKDKDEQRKRKRWERGEGKKDGRRERKYKEERGIIIHRLCRWTHIFMIFNISDKLNAVLY